MALSTDAPLQASLAGICYPSEPQALLAYFRSFFDQPKAAPWPIKNEKGEDSNFLGIVAPHIDFRVSQVAYSYAYAPWFSAPVADAYLILGVGHHARSEWSFDRRNYVTPLGSIENDRSAVDFLASQLPLPPDLSAHVKEHSIEFPLICLQAFRALRGIQEPFQFVPLLCGGLHSYVSTNAKPDDDSVLYRLAKAIKLWMQQSRKKMQIIVSIDGCHIGPRFRHPFPVDEAILNQCRLWEEELWRKVEQNDFEGFLEFLQRDSNTRYFDGVGALALIMKIFDQHFSLHRTYYEQWFEKRDASTVTFTSGYLTNR